MKSQSFQQDKFFKPWHLFLLISFVFFPSFTFATVGPASCTDGATTCGFVASYNMGIASCSLVGPDTYGGNRILGGEVCSIGGTDNPGYYMNGTGEPTNSTQYFPNTGSTPPGWTYNKTPFSHAAIPSGEFQDDPYHNIAFFGGAASLNLYSGEDDTSSLTVGSNFLQWNGCNALVTDVQKAGCPATILSQSGTNFTVNPGDPIVFNVTNVLRPSNGTGTWGTGSANVTLAEATECYTAAYFKSVNMNANGGPLTSTDVVTDYHPVAPGVCQPTPSTCSAINAFWAGSDSTQSTYIIQTGPSNPNPSVTLNWSAVNNGFPISIDNGALTSSLAPQGSVLVHPPTSNTGTVNTVYTLTCGTLHRSVTVSTVPPPHAALNVSWLSGAQSQTINLTSGQTSTNQTFNFSNVGPTGSSFTFSSCNPTASTSFGIYYTCPAAGTVFSN